MLTSVYDAHKNNEKRVIGIAQLSLSAVLKKAFNIYSINSLGDTWGNL